VPDQYQGYTGTLSSVRDRQVPPRYSASQRVTLLTHTRLIDHAGGCRWVTETRGLAHYPLTQLHSDTDTVFDPDPELC